MVKALTDAQKALLADLGGGAEVARALGISRGLLSMWVTRYSDFPAPVLELKAGRFWRLTEIREWAMRRRG